MVAKKESSKSKLQYILRIFKQRIQRESKPVLLFKIREHLDESASFVQLALPVLSRSLIIVKLEVLNFGMSGPEVPAI